MKDYFEISVKINPAVIEIVTEIFFDRFECEGVVQAEEKYKDLELIETTNNVAKGYVLCEEEDFSPSEIQKSLLTQRRTEKEGFTDEELGEWTISAKKSSIRTGRKNGKNTGNRPKPLNTSLSARRGKNVRAKKTIS